MKSKNALIALSSIFGMFLNDEAVAQQQFSPVTQVPTAVDSSCIQSLDNGGSITTYYDSDTQNIVMKASIPDNSFAAWGWGSSMTDTEIVMFSGNGADSDVQYFYSTGRTDPTAEQSKYEPCYTWTLDSTADSTI